MSDVHNLHDTIDPMRRGSDASSSSHDLGATVAESVASLRAQAAVLARRSATLTRQAALALRDEAGVAHDRGIAFVRDEPLKSLAIAAGVGAVLTGLLMLLTRPGD